MSRPFVVHPLAAASAVAVALFAATDAQAQAFQAGDLIVSRTVYAGTASTVTVGQTLPGGGTNRAIADGSFPNVFKNEVPDPSFGVTSPIFIDQYSTTGSRIGSLAVDPSLAVSSFASKSELALNVSTDGSAITFMGYKAPVNTLDVSNSNTAQVFDSTNPVGSTYARSVVQLNLSSGAMTSTAVNAYSGNNGRAAVLANGNYYMVGNAGNAGNGSGNGTTLSQLSDNTGVQSIAANGSGNTTAVGVAIGTYGSTTGYQRGFALQQLPAYASTPGKTGKDDNFRGMTVFNNTLYVTKGSGSNGVNTVYQVGAAGALANGGSLSNAAITILPGFNTTSEKLLEANTNTPAGVTHPFGIWFANSTTLFVADEGDGIRLGQAHKSTAQAGLQEWVLSDGSWSETAVFQKGLLDQATYTQGLPWNVKTDGLRNLTGTTNADGSFTLYATTSTVSDETTHDLGADPNQIVGITIGAGSTAANTSFAVLQSAAAGERFGGVALAPSSVSAVPEPQTWALMLAGLFGVGRIARRRRG
ncbi:PEP-CTERM sorting domain-containing protein [Roseateles saccharophilus]|uniref:Putative secreted protein with PEP-CTERM sorting signal/MYXO-CTERM domain-containing protein n=1 Tax=Roseateles saccharophilus TaxID=304 RepID=A0A4R3UJE1_ROSSA|nr:PEP-CTERM sorting domain-containing protein [Roseateles saccharophilus]TCU88266.1 putative secreted protein with PEP-CTERM sorting signal/MYXO-CTERM domain-containing protein [Roseateles saccharophilus]